MVNVVTVIVSTCLDSFRSGGDPTVVPGAQRANLHSVDHGFPQPVHPHVHGDFSMHGIVR